MKLHREFASVLVFGFNTSGAAAQKRAGGDDLDATREAEIKSDNFALTGDALRGREGGTLDELRASVWAVERARATVLRRRLETGFKLER